MGVLVVAGFITEVVAAGIGSRLAMFVLRLSSGLPVLPVSQVIKRDLVLRVDSDMHWVAMRISVHCLVVRIH